MQSTGRECPDRSGWPHGNARSCRRPHYLFARRGRDTVTHQRVRPTNTASAYGANQAGASHAAPRRARQSGSKRHLPSSESRRPYRFAAFLG